MPVWPVVGRWFWWLVPLVVLLAVGSYLQQQYRRGDAAFCASCHEMAPYAQALTQTSHSVFSCASCHVHIKGEVVSPGADVVRFGGWVLDHLQGRPVGGTTGLPDRVCFSCHTDKRPVSAGGDLIIPHRVHAQKGVWCVTCHQDVAHGGAGAERKSALGQVYHRWGENQAAPPMDLCTGCHQRRRVSTGCEACHGDLKMPPNHLDPDFKLKHGQAARQGVAACDQCHRYGAGQEAPTSGGVAEYAANNPFCGTCHGQMPPSHLEGDWRKNHGRSGEVASCAACHPQNPGQEGLPARTNCSQCHYRSHPPTWRQSHPVEVRGGPSKGCLTCHAERTCASCHLELKEAQPEPGA